MKTLLSHRDVETVRGDMCQFGMVSRMAGQGSELGPVLKPTGFFTNCPAIATELSRRCSGEHKHVQLMGGRAEGAAIYQKGLCESVCKGLAIQKQRDSTRTISTLPMTRSALQEIRSLCTYGVNQHVDSVLVEGVNDHD